MEFLGNVISAEGRCPDPRRVADIDKFRPHENAKMLFSFLQFANYFRKFIKDFSKKTLTLRKLLDKHIEFVWLLEHQEIVDQLKTILKSPPLISCFDPKAPTRVRVDASQSGLGAVLLQTQEEKEIVIEYASRALNKHDSTLHSNVLECM